eukprot:GCRY01001987.1.p1 GENE.GCRY01001987.1~~GCRY01001987.1.p1  ORF type:complete len:215 (+),score=45.09 GCRY01001987.1:221-865(+)
MSILFSLVKCLGMCGAEEEKNPISSNPVVPQGVPQAGLALDDASSDEQLEEGNSSIIDDNWDDFSEDEQASKVLTEVEIINPLETDRLEPEPEPEHSKDDNPASSSLPDPNAEAVAEDIDFFSDMAVNYVKPKLVSPIYNANPQKTETLPIDESILEGGWDDDTLILEDDNGDGINNEVTIDNEEEEKRKRDREERRKAAALRRQERERQKAMQ